VSHAPLCWPGDCPHPGPFSFLDLIRKQKMARAL
jgi:hypothetical protein